MECFFKNVTWKLYDEIQNGFKMIVTGKFEVKQRGLEVDELKRSDPGKYPLPENFDDPSEFSVAAKNIFYFPKGLEKFIAGVLTFGMTHCQLKEIKQEDLKVFRNLTLLNLSLNQIQVLEKDLFKFNPKLKGLMLANNIIKYIDGNVFDNLIKLQLLALIGNDCITKNVYSVVDVQKIIKKSIRNNCQTHDALPKTEKIKKTGTQRGKYFWIWVGCGVVVGIFVICAVARIVYGIVKST
ncbi:unnamed protein product [Chironomus riparius]|uniref:Uncharacterized protein n=1 Tax=Chironomus riparius TaxID=315576 RepID=A0A9N9WXX4_9DIPT|nr:unnamed protein product [Chironomus riparius]